VDGNILLAAAIDRLAAAVESYVELQRQQATPARAGQMVRSPSKPIGTGIAFDRIESNDNDTNIDRSIESNEPIDRSEFSWEDIQNERARINRWVPPKRTTWEDDTRLVVSAIVLSRTRLPESWLTNAVGAMRQKQKGSDPPRNPAAYFRTCLLDGLQRLLELPDKHAAAVELRRLESLVPPPPAEWLKVPEAKPSPYEEALARYEAERPSEERAEAARATLSDALRRKFDQISAKLSDQPEEKRA